MLSSLVRVTVWPRSPHARLLSDCLGLVAGGDRRQGGGFWGCWYCVERKRRKQPCLRKRNASGQWPSWRDRGLLLEKQEARISRTCQATRRPLAPASAHSHSPCQSSAALLSVSFWSTPLPRCLGLQLSGKAVCQSSQHGDRTPCQRDRYHIEHLLPTFLTAVNLTDTAGLLMPSSVGNHSIQEAH